MLTLATCRSDENRPQQLNIKLAAAGASLPRSPLTSVSPRHASLRRGGSFKLEHYEIGDAIPMQHEAAKEPTVTVGQPKVYASLRRGGSFSLEHYKDSTR